MMSDIVLATLAGLGGMMRWDLFQSEGAGKGSLFFVELPA